MADFPELPAEPTRDEWDKLFALASKVEAGISPFDQEFFRIARVIVPKIQRYKVRVEQELREVKLTILHEPEVQEIQQRPPVRGKAKAGAA